MIAADVFQDPALTFALALGAGMIGQVIAEHLKVPGIVVFLTLGVVLGPDGFGVIQPESLGHGLEALVGLAVAVILFEGGLNLNLRRLQSEATTIRRLVIVGALITAIGGTLAAHYVLGWDWRVSMLFGTLVIVTGPTVISPLVRRIRLNRNLQTILEAEGVLIDPVGAIVAVVALEVVLSSSATSAAVGLLGIPSRLLIGGLIGVAAGLAIGLPLRDDRWVPDGMVNTFALALLLVFFEVSEVLQNESGIMAAAMAGLVVGNMKTRVQRELKEFKEQLTVLLVGLLFVVLGADVRVAQVVGLGWPGLLTVLALVFIVRPLGVAVCTAGSRLNLRERTLLAWVAPRGIVAAAVASLFAQDLAGRGIEGGTELRALVFMVIAVTVVAQGLTGGFVASLLGVRRTRNNGYVIVGANGLGRTLSRLLAEKGQDAVLIDTNPRATTKAEQEGLSVIYGNANDERILLRADVEGRIGFVAVTGNEAVNLLVSQRAGQLSRSLDRYVALTRGKGGVRSRELARGGHQMLGGRPFDPAHWDVALDEGRAVLGRFRYEGGRGGDPADPPLGGETASAAFLTLTVERKGKTRPMGDSEEPVTGEVRAVIFLEDRRDAVVALFGERGWVEV